MAQIFHPSTNAFSKATIFGGVFILAGVAWAGSLLSRSSYVTQVNVVRDQPVPFSHDHHVSGLGIDCRYCHTSVENSSVAGIPSTEICMGCHSVIWKDSALLEPVRESFRTKTPLQWTRVHDVPDYVYFDHSIHVAKGVSCESCHGRVDEMPLMRKVHSLHMEWCLECHRAPELKIGDRKDVFKFGVGGPTTVADHDRAGHADHAGHASEPKLGSGVKVKLHGEELAEQYGINKSQLTDCAICHR